MTSRRDSDEIRIEYDRSRLTPGSSLGSNEADEALVLSLENARRIRFEVGFGKVGDSLLALSVITACMDWLRIIRPDDLPEIVLRTPQAELFALARWGEEQPRFRIERAEVFGTDRLIFEGADRVGSTAERSYAGTLLPHPRVVEPTSKGDLVHPSLPARLYLAFERAAGIALGRSPLLCLPAFQADRPTPTRQNDDDEIRIAVVVTAGWPQKQFGAARFLSALDALARNHRHRRFRVVLIVSPDRNELDPSVEAAIRRFPGSVQIADEAGLARLASRLSAVDAAVGNDTGLSHLAALTVSGRSGALLPTAIVYAHVDPTYWATGGKNVHPLPSPFARLLGDSRTTFSQASARPEASGTNAEAKSVPEDAVIDRLERMLRLRA